MVVSNDHFTLARLSEEHQPILANFNCLHEEELGQYDSKKRKRITELSLEMNRFLQEEALDEQTNGLNNTFLFFQDQALIAFVSLCADAIRLSTEEQAVTGVSYQTVPAIKVARLAVDFRFQRLGLGRKLLKFSIATALKISSNFCGVKFLTVDCYPHRLSYYEQFGFVSNEIHNQDRASHHPISMRLDIVEYLENL